MLGGGQYNGQFVVFDMRHGSAAVDATPIEKSHRCASCQPFWMIASDQDSL